MLKETSINQKIKKYLSFTEKMLQNSQENTVKIGFKDEKIERIQLVSQFMDRHKKCLIDFSLFELFKIMNDFLIIKKLDNGRLLFLQRKVNKCKKILFMMVECQHKKQTN